MSYVLGQIVAPDSYTAAATIEDVPIEGISIDVVNSSILWQLKLATYGGRGYYESTETPMLPGSRSIHSDQPGEIVGIRIRAKIPLAQIPVGGNQAVVTVRTDP